MRNLAVPFAVLAAGAAVAVIWPDGRIWMLAAVLAGTEVLARRAWRGGTKWPAIVLWSAVLLLAATAWIGRPADAADEAATRRLYTEPVRGNQLRKGTAEGPTGIVEAQLVLVNDELISVQFFHQEPPWIGDPVLQRLAAAIAEAKRLVPPREGPLTAPIERAGLRACELALLPPASATVAGSQARPVLMALPAILLLALLGGLALGRLASRDPVATS
ncbi:MAG: hypothetical protein ACYTGX_07490 [Planctomycetota bacterium]|jgi:hypothetical protein